jgi:hypothetical protein
VHPNKKSEEDVFPGHIAKSFASLIHQHKPQGQLLTLMGAGQMWAMFWSIFVYLKPTVVDTATKDGEPRPPEAQDCYSGWAVI